MEFNIFTFPWEQIGWCLRQLSLSGAVGNIIAIIIYLFVGSIPCGIYLMLRKKEKSCKIDFLLVLISVLLFVMLYYMINPGLLQSVMAGSGKYLLGGTFYSALVGYLVLRVMHQKHEADLQSIQKGLRKVLIIVMILFAWAAVAEFVFVLPTAIQNVQEGNSVSDSFFFEAPDLTWTYAFLTLQSVVNALPNGLCAVGTLFCIKAVGELLQDSYSEKAVFQIKRIVAFCKKSLSIVVVSGVVFNLAQMLFSGRLYYMNISINIPIFAILFMLAIHVFARYIEENQKLKEDNSLFI